MMVPQYASIIPTITWTADLQYENDKGVQKAIAQPPQCPQALQGAANRNPFLANGTGGHGLHKHQSAGVAPTDTPISEDCLFINVQYPGNTVSSTKLPVLVYIHGRGYILGGANLYDGTFLIEESNQEAILVVMQYRLGLFGFLAGDEVEKNGDLNVGLLDQSFVLRWVRAHISKFGGDPNKLRFGGNPLVSSGSGGSVLQQVIAENGKTSPQLFHTAIASSPYLPAQYKYDDKIPMTLYKQVVDGVNCTSAHDALACPRQTDTKALQTINSNINAAGFYGSFNFVPVVDGKFITQRPTKSMRQGKVNGDMYVNNATTPLSAGSFASQLSPTLKSKQMAEIDSLYKDLGPPLDQENLVVGESLFVCPTYYLRLSRAPLTR
ncbi:hypothetical protein E1B28_005099 [Marasmius oreades]|uniref:Carboxylesterase type B domain-containing protein n=1 Tax=Marasmius oreades TaxID=181124 RepID=A0A9P7UZX3_9AGAR|nr:uncharacterized protein E1B28_005099 [Marasmius oreades]KAG7097780.1 hypothetical protein E1B28_005099 [Marasmius oreades]